MAFSSGVMRYFYPRPPRGRRRENIQCEAKLLAISIHALREEGDHPYSSWERGSNEFLSTPSARRATCPLPTTTRSARFLSTPSARRATTTILTALRHLEKFLSTPSARRATHIDLARDLACDISIHALREEGDVVSLKGYLSHSDFYPRPPRGGRRRSRYCRPPQRYFYPRPPRGGRHAHISIPAPFAQFLSTPSARRATYKRTELEPSMDISIHALREEGDL